MDAKERDKAIASMYLEENKSASELSIEFNLGIARIYQILKDQGATKRDDTVRPRVKAEGTRAISQAHVKIGLKLYSYRQFDTCKDRNTVNEELGWSLKKIALVEKGETQLTLTDLMQLAAYMDITPSELMRDLETTGFGA